MSNTIYLFESINRNLEEAILTQEIGGIKFEWLTKENLEKYTNLPEIYGNNDLDCRDTAEELGISEEEAIKNQAERFGVEIVYDEVLGGEMGGSAGGHNITVKGTPNGVAQFMSNGEAETLAEHIAFADMLVAPVEEKVTEGIEDLSDKVGGNYDDFIAEVSELRNRIVNYTDECATHLGERVVEELVTAFDNIIKRLEQEKDIEIEGALLDK